MDHLNLIGVIADTHGRLDPRIPEWFAAADVILHAGDIGPAEILDELAAVAPVVAVLGNNDFLGHLRELERRQYNGHRFYLCHILPKRLPDAADWLIFGHTHRPHDEIRQGVRLFNPGSAGLANKGAPRSIALLRWNGEAWEPELRVL